MSTMIDLEFIGVRVHVRQATADGSGWGGRACACVCVFTALSRGWQPVAESTPVAGRSIEQAAAAGAGPRPVIVRCLLCPCHLVQGTWVGLQPRVTSRSECFCPSPLYCFICCGLFFPLPGCYVCSSLLGCFCFVYELLFFLYLDEL